MPLALIFITTVVVISVRSAGLTESTHRLNSAGQMVKAAASVTTPMASIIVNTTDDALDSNDGKCSFREALIHANFDGGPIGIPGECAPGSGDDTISIPVSGTINLSSELPAISTNMTIIGSGSDRLTIRRDTGGDYRILTIDNLTTVSISGVTLKNGRASSPSSGGGIGTGGILTLTSVIVTENTTTDGVTGSPSAGSGGGICNCGSGSLTMIDSVVSNNTTGNGVVGASGNGNGGRGGGIESSAPITVINTLVTGNTTGTGPGGSGSGAGLFVGFQATIINSTFSGNMTGAAPADGGGIWISGNSTITNTTVTGNLASGSGHGIFAGFTGTTVRNTIVARNGSNGPDIGGASFTTAGHNLIGDADGSTGFTNSLNGDQVGSTTNPINPRLGPLLFNGGIFETHGLLPGSPAIDAGDNCVLTNSCSPALGSSISNDQRGAGFTRSADGDGDGTAVVDIGSFEVQSLLVTNLNNMGPGSLRQAITNGQANQSPKSINFQSGLTGTIALSSELPVIFTSMSINGPGANVITVSRSLAPGTPQFRIFTIQNITTTVLVRGLTITNGLAASGGAIFNEGDCTLTLEACDLNNNVATDFGGAIFNRGTLTVRDSLISGNSVNNFVGGALINRGFCVGQNCTNAPSATLVNTTITGNQAVFGGGGIYDDIGSRLTLLNCTITNNTALAQGSTGGVHSNSIHPKIRNTIVAGNIGTVPDVAAPFVSQGHNLIGRSDGSNGFTNGVNGDLVGTAATPLNARLGELSDNGGLTRTHALLAGSPALDAGDNCVFNFTCVPTYGFALTTDQRRGVFSRQVDGPDADTTATVDIGAFEAQVSIPDFADQTINEDASLSLPFNVGGAASITSISATSNNTTLVPNSASNISISGTGSTRTLLINPVANLSGLATITVTVNGSNSQTMSDTFVLTVNSINDAPSFTKGADQTVNEDSGAQTVSTWATSISAGPANEAGQTLTFQVTGNSNSTLFAVQPTISSSGTLTYTPAANQAGSANITIVLKDNGGTALGGSDTSGSQSFTITVNAVNDAPSFIKGADKTVNEDSGAQSISNWATLISAGPNETGQTLTFEVTANSNPGLFATQPAISSTGTLTYTPQANQSGSANITIVLKDNGGTSLGGSDTSGAQSFTINVNSVNDAPSFTKGADQTVAEDSGAQTVSNWATAVLSGPPDEVGQTVTFTTTNDNNSLFSVQPGISPTGALTYTSAANANGSAVVSVSLKDNGGVTNGGQDTSAVQTFTINVTAVNDPPVNTVPGPQVITAVQTLMLSSGTGNAISIADIDAGSNAIQVTLTATNGTASLNGIGGLTFTSGDGTDDATMTFSGTIANINVALNGMTFKPASGFVGSTSLQIATNDLGNTGSGGPLSDTDVINITITPAGGTISFLSSTLVTEENAGTAFVTVQRTGDTSQAVSVHYATADQSESTGVFPCSTTNGIASSRCDYTTASGTLTFLAGETSKVFKILISQDSYTENLEGLQVTLSNPNNGAALGTPSTATLQISDDPIEPNANVIDNPANFVTQQYHDFLNREPDPAGLAFWTNEITSCGSDPQCIEVKRINVSAAFYLSIEFQETGFLVHRTYKSAYGNLPGLPVPLKFNEFLPDARQISDGVQVGIGAWQAQLEANKVAYFSDFVTRDRFVASYPLLLAPSQFVDMLFLNAAVIPTAVERQSAIDEFGGAATSAGTLARARALRRVAENSSFTQQEFNPAFVLMEYFGYMRRNPDATPDANFNGWQFWLNKLDQFHGNFVNAEMVKAFIVSSEYRSRFGQP